MSITIWAGGIPNYSSERELLLKIARSLSKSDEKYVLFVGVTIPPSSRTDAIIFSERGIFLIEIKRIYGTLNAPLNGRWYIEEDPEKTKRVLNKGKKNPYQQIENYSLSFIKFLSDRSDLYRETNLSNLKPRSFKPFIFNAIVVTGKLTDQSKIEKHKLIKVLLFEELLEFLYYEGKPAACLTFEEIDRLAKKVLNLELYHEPLRILKGPPLPMDINFIKECILKRLSSEPFIKPRGIIEKEKKFNTEEFFVYDFIKKINHCVIVGEIGSGKTVLSHRFSAEQSNCADGLLCLCIPLTFYKSETGIIGLISETLKNLGYSILPEDVELLLEGDEKLSIIFDGFNELNQRERERCLWEIEKLMALYPGFQIIVTCKSEYYNNEFKNIDVIKLLPWTDFQIKEYLGLHIDSPESIADFFAKSRLSKFQENMLSRPLFIKYLVQEYKEKGELPSNQKELLECIADKRLFASKSDQASLSLSSDSKQYLSEMAFLMHDELKMVEDIEKLRAHCLERFQKDGGVNNLGYHFKDLWACLFDSGFIKPFGSKVSFTHEIWQEYFTSLYIEGKISNLQKIISKLIKNIWWNKPVLYAFYSMGKNQIEKILSAALDQNNYDLVGYALRREAGVNANYVAQNIISTLLDSHKQPEQERAYGILELALDSPWTIRTLLNHINAEQRKFLPEGKNETYLYNSVHWHSAGYSAYRALTKNVYSFSNSMPIDAIDELLDIEDYLPLARTSATELLRGAVGILTNTELVSTLEKRSKDKFPLVRAKVVDVIEKLLCEPYFSSLQKCSSYDKVISILKALANDKYLIVYQPANELLVRIGEVDLTVWTKEESESIILRAKTAIAQKDPNMGYYLVINSFYDIIGDAYMEANENLSDAEKRELLRLTIDYVLENREELETLNEKLESISDINERSRLLESAPQLYWSSFGWVLDEFKKIANRDDIERLKQFIGNPLTMWQNMGNSSLEISWSAARALVGIGGDEVRGIFTNFLVENDERSIISILALEYGYHTKKWESTSSEIAIYRRNIINSIFKGRFLSALTELVNIAGIPYEVCQTFLEKFGNERVREIIRDIIGSETDTVFKFMERFEIFREASVIREILRDPARSDYHKKVISLLNKLRD